MQSLRHGSVAILIAPLCVPCGGGQEDYIRARIDGKRMEFMVNADAHVSGKDGRIQFVTFGALSSEDRTNPARSFEVEDESGELRPGTYDQHHDAFGRYYWQIPSSTYMHTSTSDAPVRHQVHANR